MDIPLRPFLIRAVYEWVIRNHLTPFLNVDPEIEADKICVPMQYFNTKSGMVVFNISPTVVSNFEVAEWSVTFDTSFQQLPVHIFLPIQSTVAIYAKENSFGLILPHEDWDAHTQDIISYINPAFKSKPKLSIVRDDTRLV